MKPIKSVQTDIESAIPRDQWERPLILPPDGSDAKPVAYRRASTVAEVLEDHFGLNEWKKRLVAQGLAQRPDLVHAVHGASRTEVGAICEEAFEQAGGSVAARNGATMHALTERIDTGQDLPPGLPSNILAMCEKYAEETSRLKVLDTERFVVQDKIKVAGTYDRRLHDVKTDTIYIGDLKTGQNLDLMALKTCAQVAVYAAAKHYDLDGEREGHGANRDRGLFIWLPWAEKPEQAVCEIRTLDLVIGRAAIKEAFRVERFRKLKASQLMTHLR